jgi:hypothetical protein
MVLEPMAMDVAKPVPMVAFPVSEELQVACKVRSCVPLFDNVPVAANCCVLPRLMFGLAGDIAMDASVAIVSVVEPEMLSEVAVMVVVPAATAVARPSLLMVAAAVSDALHVADAVKSCVVLSEYVPVAVNCCEVPFAMLGLAGVIEIEASEAASPPPLRLQAVSSNEPHNTNTAEIQNHLFSIIN